MSAIVVAVWAVRLAAVGLGVWLMVQGVREHRRFRAASTRFRRVFESHDRLSACRAGLRICLPGDLDPCDDCCLLRQAEKPAMARKLASGGPSWLIPPERGDR